MTTTNKDTICVLPWSGARIDAMGRVAPCCLYDGHVSKDHTLYSPEHLKYKVQEDHMDEILKSQELEDLRNAMLRGEKPKACQACWQEEDAGGWSKRMRENERTAHVYNQIKSEQTVEPKLVHWDLNLGNVCNLRCRICGSHSSSLWSRDIKQMDKKLGKDAGAIKSNDWEHMEEAYRDGQWSLRDDIPFWDYLFEHITDAATIEFYGGEPLFQKKHGETIQHIIDSGNAHKIHLHYNTNGTVFDEKAIKEYWPQFKWVSVMFSIDGVGERFNYMRNPAKWSEVSANVQKYLEMRGDNMKFELCPTINVLSYYYISELIDWAESIELPIWMNLLHHPAYLNIQSYPKKLKQEIINKYSHRKDLQNYNEFMMATDKQEIDNFWRHTNFWDKWRGEDFSQVFPELADKMECND